jgi:hypothetical protein
MVAPFSWMIRMVADHITIFGGQFRQRFWLWDGLSHVRDQLQLA